MRAITFTQPEPIPEPELEPVVAGAKNIGTVTIKLDFSETLFQQLTQLAEKTSHAQKMMEAMEKEYNKLFTRGYK